MLRILEERSIGKRARAAQEQSVFDPRPDIIEMIHNYEVVGDLESAWKLVPEWVNATGMGGQARILVQELHPDERLELAAEMRETFGSAEEWVERQIQNNAKLRKRMIGYALEDELKREDSPPPLVGARVKRPKEENNPDTERIRKQQPWGQIIHGRYE